MILNHWEHTEYVDENQYHLFSKFQLVIPASVSLSYNTAVYVSNGEKRLEAIYDPALKGIRPLKPCTGAANRDLRLYLDALSNENITILAIDGLMGTGKTSTAVEWAIDTHLKNVKMFLNPEDSFNRGGHKIVIAKPHVNSGGESYGHLPGDINQKIDPTIINFTQYFDRLHQAGYEKLRDAGYVEILPLGFVRGMDASNVTVIADECQNTKELITLVTRKSNKSRIILLGDTSPFQIDKAGNTPDKNGLTDVIDLLRGATYFQHIEMKTVEHVVRSEETRDVVRRLFKKHGHDIAAWGTTQRG